MASAVALEHDGLRLRSRRTRFGRSHRLSWALLVAVFAMASAVGFAGANAIVRTSTIPLVQAAPAVDAAAADAAARASLERQRFGSELRPIRAQMQQSVATLGLAVAAFENGEIDRSELQRRVAGVLASYRDVAGQIHSLDASPGEQAALTAEYVGALNQLTQSATQLSRAYDDGDRRGVAQALAASLQAVAELHGLSSPRA